MRNKNIINCEFIRRNLSLVGTLFFLTVVFAAASPRPAAPPDVKNGMPSSGGNGQLAFSLEKIVYQFVQGNNYEILVMNADGTNRINLTNNEAADIQPSFSRNGSKIVFTSERDGDQEIYVMNADGSNPVRLTESGGNSYPQFSPDGSKIVFTSFRDGNFEIYIMNADGSNQINLTENESFDYTPSFSPDGSKIVFASLRDGNQEIYEMNPDGTDPTRLTFNLNADFAPSFSPDGERIVFTSVYNGNNLEIQIMNADGGDQVRLTDNPDSDDQASFSPDGGKIVFTSQRDCNFEIYVMNTDGSIQINLTNTMATGELKPTWVVQSDWDGDGVPDYRDNCRSVPNPEKIAFSSDRHGFTKILVMNADGSDQTILTNSLKPDVDPEFSHDGSKIAFVNRDAGFNIYLMDADGGNRHYLTWTDYVYPRHSFSPDDERIVFTSRGNSTTEIFVINVDGSNRIPLTNTSASDREPSFSPDGSKIVFTSFRDGNSEIYVMNADGTNPARLTNNPASDENPTYSPDGSKIVFTSDRDGNREIYSMNADGSNPINLTNNATDDSDATFSTDGTKIAYQSLINQNYEIVLMNVDGSNPVRLTDNIAGDFTPSWGAQADSDHDGTGDACENSAPTIETYYVSRPQGASSVSAIALVGDPDQNPRSLSVTVNGLQSATVNGVTVTITDITFPPGTVKALVSAACEATNANFTLRVTDNGGLFSEETLHVTTTPDTIPPVINLKPSIVNLFPPNHQYAVIGVDQMTASVSDNCSALSTNDVFIKKVTSDEVDDAPGGSDGNTVNDIVIVAGCRFVRLRAERDDVRNGRVYTVTLMVRDAAGNTTRAKFNVGVPKSQNGFPAVRDATAATILGGCS